MDYWREKRDQTNPSRILITKVAMNFIRWLLLAFIIIKLDDWVWLHQEPGPVTGNLKKQGV